MKRPFAPQTNNNCYETDTHNVSLTGNEISTILYIMEGYIDPSDDYAYDPDFREDVDNIFVKLEGVTDAYYERLEKLEYNQKHEERRIK
tara:strand:- start:62 stop:328 length:267 start_codon:yes stop_codon:yes gene_type:complete